MNTIQFVQEGTLQLPPSRPVPLVRSLSVGGSSALRAMEKYENMGLVGEGSYGMVLKCKHKETGQLVAIKKFLESEDDKMVKKIAMREVRMLKQLRHDHLVNLLEVFRRKKRLYLVFEFVDHTVLDELEKCPNGLDEVTTRKILWQVLKGIEFCHLNNIIHRDIKPENILVSKSGIVKLCDFGFARTLAQPGEIYTDYVATRWYRAPELLVGDTKYGRAVDIWAVGCLLAEMLTGDPLFPGDSDIDQLYHIVKVFGNLTQRHKEVFMRNPLFVGMRLPEVREITPLEKKFNRISSHSLEFMKHCLKLDPDDRPTTSQLLKHDFFQRDGFGQRFSHDLRAKIQREHQDNPLMKSLAKDKEKESQGDNKEASPEPAGNNKTPTKLKKKKLIPAPKKEGETKDAKTTKDVHESTKENTEEKPKRKLPDPEKATKKPPDGEKVVKKVPDEKVTKKTPPVSQQSNHVTLPQAQGRTSQNKIEVEEVRTKEKKEKEKSGEKKDKAHVDKTDKVHAVKTDMGDKSDKLTKAETKGDNEKDAKNKSSAEKEGKVVKKQTSGEKKKDKSESDKSVKVENDSSTDRSDSKLDKDRSESKLEKDRSDSKAEKEKNDRQEVMDRMDRLERMDKMDRIEHKTDSKLERLDPGVKDKLEGSKEREKQEKFKEKENGSSTSIPPINQSGQMHSVTPTAIPSLSRVLIVLHSISPLVNTQLATVNNLSLTSPFGSSSHSGPPPLRVNEKVVKKPTMNMKKQMTNHHSMTISPQPLQSEKSLLHDKSLEKLRSKTREPLTSRDLQVDTRKEGLSLPEVKGAEANPSKIAVKQKPSNQRTSLATIPHIANIDPFPATQTGSMGDSHGSEKSDNLPSV